MNHTLVHSFNSQIERERERLEIGFKHETTSVQQQIVNTQKIK